MDKQNFYIKTYKYLLSYGFSPLHKGFKIIIEAVMLLCECKHKYSFGIIYSMIAQKNNISPISVQKNIKNAIDYASLNCNIDSFTKEFGALIKDGGITCGSFLSFTADKIHYG